MIQNKVYIISPCTATFTIFENHNTQDYILTCISNSKELWKRSWSRSKRMHIQTLFVILVSTPKPEQIYLYSVLKKADLSAHLM